MSQNISFKAFGVGGYCYNYWEKVSIEDAIIMHCKWDHVNNLNLDVQLQ